MNLNLTLSRISALSPAEFKLLNTLAYSIGMNGTVFLEAATTIKYD